MPDTYTIYALSDPRTHRFYYVGQTMRPLHDRLDEHFFETSNTLVSEMNQIIIKSGMLPQVVVLDEVKNVKIAFHRELYWIHKLASEGHRLKNRETQQWFVKQYDNRNSGQATKTAKKPRKEPHKNIPDLKAVTYEEAARLAPGIDIKAEEKAWRKWLAGPGKTAPNNPDAHFLSFLKNAKQ